MAGLGARSGRLHHRAASLGHAAGTAFVHAMDQAVQHTRHVLLVLSPAYLRSEMAEAEWRPAFKADPSGEARRLLPVRAEACEPAGLLADRVYIDLGPPTGATT
jgi:TIR domain